MPLRLVTKSKENTLRPYHSPPIKNHEDGPRYGNEIREKLDGTYVRILNLLCAKQAEFKVIRKSLGIKSLQGLKKRVLEKANYYR